ncbi:MAG: methyl-accepting chemotaxis protein, partial [Chromatiales bacterium]|nr:methyl-accepting chemotaxis protein [Chromatiales bacterium]
MNLRTRLTAAMIAITLLVAAVLLFSGKVSQELIETRYEDVTYSGKSLLWQNIVSFQIHNMEMSIPSIARDRVLRKAIKNRDAEKIASGAASTYNLLSASKIITELVITDTQGNIIFSAPNKLSGKSDNPLINHAVREGKIHGNVVPNQNNGLSLSLVFPIYNRGKAIGVGIYQRDLKDALAEFKKSEGSDVIILDAKGQVSETTSDGLYRQLDVELPPLGERSFNIIDLGETINSVTIQPVTGDEDSLLGYLINVSDYTESYSKQQSSSLITYSVIIISILMAIFVTYWYIQRSLRPLQDNVGELQAISAGDLTGNIEVIGDCEIGQQQEAMRSMLENLRQMIQTIHDISAQMGNASQQLMTVTNETEMGVAQQQQETESVATAMNEMTATVSEVAQNAVRASEAANKANQESKEGLRLVQQTVESINTLATDVDHSSGLIHTLETEANNIGSVVDVIRGIAEQTNLLALNAAIEAA